jgi:y4mF family transcriptional regulator
MSIKDPKSLGALIREARKQSRVTQKELALVAGTGLRFIGELENGKPTCHIGKVFEVLRSLGLEIKVERR